MSLSAAITALVTVAGTVSGVVRVYTDPPESISEFPAALVYAERGELTSVSRGFKKHIHRIRIDIISGRTQLPAAVNEAKAWVDGLYSGIVADEQLGGVAAGIDWPITYEAISMPYNNLTHYGIRFTIPVKIH